MDKRALYILCASVLPLMVCSGIVYSVLTLYISEDLGASRTQIGFIFMAGSLAGGIVSPFVGRLSDRFGRRPLMLSSMIGFVIVFILYALARQVLHLVPVQILEGVTWAAFGSAITAFIADIVPSESRGWAMGIYGQTYSLGWVIGPALGGFMADTIGFRITFIIGSILIALGIALVYKLVKEPAKSSEAMKKGL